MQIVEVANLLFGVLAIIAQISVVVIAGALFIRTGISKKILEFFGKNALLFSFLVALVATLGSLFYSEIARYEPCKLCWFQRILMYPQVLLLGAAFVKRDKHIGSYAMLLSGAGAVIAAYHYLLQRGVVQELVPCSAVGYSVTCAQKFVMQFGYITIPLMALSGFLLILFLFIAQRAMAKKG